MSSSHERAAPVSFVERHGLWSDEDVEAAGRADQMIQERRLEVVRFSFADQHGILRGKTVVAADAARAMCNGCLITTTLIAKDTSHRTVFPLFTPGGGFGMPEMACGADCLMLPDPTTFQVLPWAPQTGWVLCDLYFANGAPVPFSTRHLFRQALAGLAQAGFEYRAGLEVEFHVFKIEKERLDPADATWPGEAPQVSVIAPGYQYLTETRFDQIEPIVEIVRRNVEALGLPLRSVELELGPSQCEFTFQPEFGLKPADSMMLFRSAVKQVCRRHGYLASFMCRPRVPNTLASGWHLHQSLFERRPRANAFAPIVEGDLLSPIGRGFLGGLIEHARAATAFATPTINGYKRYRAYALAPDRVGWGRDNRGAMVRVLGDRGEATRLENRIGEPAANPYLYMASQVLAGLDGMARKLDPGPSADTPYEGVAPFLPRTLEEALASLRQDACFADGLGQGFIDYYLRLKEHELARYRAEVTDWEQREYFELF